jgi:hypothetical protein
MPDRKLKLPRREYDQGRGVHYILSFQRPGRLEEHTFRVEDSISDEAGLWHVI